VREEILDDASEIEELENTSVNNLDDVSENNVETSQANNMEDNKLEDRISGVVSPTNTDTFVAKPSSFMAEIERNNSVNNNSVGSSSPTFNHSNKHGYVSYETKLALKVLIIVVMFVAACLLLILALNNRIVEVITYDESSTVEYSVCLLPNEYYRDECLGAGMEYLSSITEKIPVTINYNAVYTSEVEYNYKYSIKSTLKINRPDDESKVLYETEEVLLDDKDISGKSNVINITEGVVIPYAKYNTYVNDYNNRYALDSDASVDVSLYVTTSDGTTNKVGGVVIPLATQTYNITKDEKSNHNLVASASKTIWENKALIYAGISGVLSLIGIIAVIRLILFIIKASPKRSEYEDRLRQILREYDRIIVQVEDGQTFVSDKKIIKVHSFLELLDARDTLEKPIVYVRVNNVKSEFYVEDIDKVYKYTMKESDFLKMKK